MRKAAISTYPYHGIKLATITHTGCFISAKNKSAKTFNPTTWMSDFVLLLIMGEIPMQGLGA